MIFSIIVMDLVGLLCIIMGLLIWKKQKIELLHDYHRSKVTDADKPAFCRLSGWGLLCIGAGIGIAAVAFAITESLWSFLGFGLGFVPGLALLVYAGNKYNSGHKNWTCRNASPVLYLQHHAVFENGNFPLIQSFMLQLCLGSRFFLRKYKISGIPRIFPLYIVAFFLYYIE